VKALLIFAALVALAGDAASPIHTPSLELDVRDFGARADGVGDDFPAIQSALAKILSSGTGGVLFLPAGTYKISHAIMISRAKNLTVRGEPQTLLLMDNMDQAMMKIQDCQNLTVRDMSFDRAPLHQTQGTIDAVDLSAMTCDVTIDPGYAGFDAPQLAQAGTFAPFTHPESGTYELDRYYSTFVSASPLGANRWKVTFKGRPPQKEWTGKKFGFWTGGRGHCFEVAGLQDALFENLHYCGGASAGLYMSGLSGTVTFRHFDIGPPSGSNRLLAECGGAQISKMRGILVFDNCHFSHIDDDGLDLLGNWTRVVDQSDPRTLHLQTDAGVQVGDHVELWDWALKASSGNAVVEQVSTHPDRSVTVALDRDLKAQRMGEGKGPPFGRDAQSDGIDRVIDLDTLGQQTIIRNCSFQVFRAKCLNLKVNNCLVENCTFDDSFQPAISAAPEWYFEEGPTVRHLIIRNNSFTTCNHSNIEIGPGISPPPQSSRDTLDVLIEGNHFADYGALPSVFPFYPIGDAIRVQNAKDVTIRNNDFGQPAVSAPQGTPKLIVENSDHVVIEQNANLSPSQIQQVNVSP
jgi:hypothetical protein